MKFVPISPKNVYTSITFIGITETSDIVELNLIFLKWFLL